MGLPDSRAGSGYGASSKFAPPGAASLGSPYKSADSFPYTDEDIDLEDEDEAMDDEDAEKALQQNRMKTVLLSIVDKSVQEMTTENRYNTGFQ